MAVVVVGVVVVVEQSVTMGVRLLLLQGALQAMTPPGLWIHPAVADAALAPGSSPALRCSSSGSSRISAASPRARAATAPYTCTLGGGGVGRREKRGRSRILH